jgi:hypothetical protein
MMKFPTREIFDDNVQDTQRYDTYNKAIAKTRQDSEEMRRGSGAEEITFLFPCGIYILQEIVYTALPAVRVRVRVGVGVGVSVSVGPVNPHPSMRLWFCATTLMIPVHERFQGARLCLIPQSIPLLFHHSPPSEAAFHATLGCFNVRHAS